MNVNASARYLRKLIVPILFFIAMVTHASWATNGVKNSFLSAYPSAAGTRLVTINGVNHCGLCHWDFTGNDGTLNPYGTAIFNTMETPAAILAIGTQDADGDLFTNNAEIMGTGFSNIPTFPGYTASNVNLVTNLPAGFTIANLGGFVVPTGTTAQVGSLQVTLAPAAAVTATAQWNVDGGAWQNSAATVTGLSVGTHTVNCKAITGWTAPASTTVSIASGATATLTRTYTVIAQAGNLTVTLAPAAAVTATAQWNVDGGAWQNSAATVTGLSVGTHTVNYKAITGWTAPASESVSITNGVTATLSRSYTVITQVGSLQVTLAPAAAVTATAQWNVDGGAWQNSAATVTGLSVGTHTVNCKAITGWTAPASTTVSIASGATATLTRTYTAITQVGSLQVTLAPAAAVTATAQWNVDGGAWQNSAATVTGLSVGTHTVNYKAITGWTAPASESVSITNGVTATLSRSYTAVATTDTTAPTPNPMTWASMPAATGPASIAMVAADASDASGVEYYFTCVSGGGHDSGWQTGANYEDVGLTPDTQYGYSVRARDMSANHNVTGASVIAAATTTPAGSLMENYADSDISVAGKTVGSYLDMQTSDDVYETITEAATSHSDDTAGEDGEHVTGYSWLEHKWTIKVTNGQAAAFFIEAHHSVSSDGDNVIFAYSTDNVTYRDMVTITKTSDDDAFQQFALPPYSGTIYIRARDTNRAQGHTSVDSLYIDKMYITSQPLTGVIIDNGRPGTSSKGAWQVSGAPNPYGTDSLWARNGATYTWQMTAQPSGTYEVLMYWTSMSSRTASAAVDIVSASGSRRVYVNQLLNGGTWNSLGTFAFNGSGSVTITAANGSTVSTCADAVWFRPVSASTVPAAIIDNGSAGTSSTGTWQVSSAPHPYGANSLWSFSGATYTWSFTPAVTGTYRLSMWWTALSTRSSSVPVRVGYSGGTANVTVNQRQNGGMWNSLGNYTLNAGTTYKVTITAPQGSPPSTCADAVQFEKL